jgi:catechol 2,3-dioxygenase-like lactoylglutathione lyase family enzyme
MPRLVPELDVRDLNASLAFYCELLGFTLVFTRSAERFAFLDREGVSVMLEEAAGPGRRFRTAPLERPYGRGINFQAAATDVDELFARVRTSGAAVLVTLEERWYDVDVVAPSGRFTRRGPMAAGNRQFVVADPDGYLWRFFSDLGLRARGGDTAATDYYGAEPRGSCSCWIDPSPKTSPAKSRATVAPLGFRNVNSVNSGVLKLPLDLRKCRERATRIELAFSAWEIDRSILWRTRRNCFGWSEGVYELCRTPPDGGECGINVGSNPAP